jgi:hypothetical protein
VTARFDEAVQAAYMAEFTANCVSLAISGTANTSAEYRESIVLVKSVGTNAHVLLSDNGTDATNAHWNISDGEVWEVRLKDKRYLSVLGESSGTGTLYIQPVDKDKALV